MSVPLRLSEGDWDATLIQCRSAGAPMSQDANTMEQEHPGPSSWPWMVFALASTQIGRSWSLMRPCAIPHLVRRSESELCRDSCFTRAVGLACSSPDLCATKRLPRR
jgi:hypothetical protein